MCGIGGFLSTQLNNQEVAHVCNKMARTLSARGPDDEGIWIHSPDGVALFHRRLAINDLSENGRQPIFSFDSRFLLSLNGEIYNYEKLRQELVDKGIIFKGRCDAEVLVNSISIWGLDETLKKLEGMFAFALWDNLKKRLFLVRDRIGEKPLFYGIFSDSFVFASELKAIQKFPFFKNQLEKQAIDYFLNLGWIPSPSCIFKDVKKLNPGTVLTIERSEGKIKSSEYSYWSITALLLKGETSNYSLTSEYLKILLKNKIDDILKADVPVGFFLSGGIDSTLLTTLAQIQTREQLKTFTLGFEDKEYDESLFGKAVAKILQTDHFSVKFSRSELPQIISELPMVFDEPMADFSQIPTLFLSKIAAKKVKVIVTGDGGDELFGGYVRHLYGPRIWSLTSLIPSSIRDLFSGFQDSIFFPRSFFEIYGRRKVSHFGVKLQKLLELMSSSSFSKFYSKLLGQGKCLGKEVLSQNEKLRFFLENSELSKFSIAEKIMVLDMLLYLPDDLLVKLDRCTMANGLEGRSPFLNHYIIEFALNLQKKQKIRNSSGKAMLIEILEDYFPKGFFKRPKTGFSPPINTWLRSDLKKIVEEKIFSGSFLKENPNFFSRAKLFWENHQSGKYDLSYQIWTLFTFQNWLDFNGIAAGTIF
ncbi:MAG: asparagine synthase (glutamine-hydrolyzing) [Candidatus Riflebacteria bacterium]|nr:asparagine synthase (glutamine-hydrolyzing) [Candidatus Riflebacteria bacterium]